MMKSQRQKTHFLKWIIKTNRTNNTNSANNTSNNTSNNASTYDNANTISNSSTLPHTGTSSKGVLLVIVSMLSAIYAYKKVSDYNL